ncbi:hypothetical protein SDC9_88140 [bioreactor metagenome]|uniref:Site-specific DNA-methyltransferase (adenine-specific) n=1 Tax=bioreactor metagenome TaxID=1076179 RepID=A0A644ZKR5_9ZZZZ|nr:DNA adenine methylase [Bacteroidaceae bacterium]
MDSFIGWVGGKKALRDVIISKFPENIGRYVEVFGGAGWVMFRKDKVPGQMKLNKYKITHLKEFLLFFHIKNFFE